MKLFLMHLNFFVIFSYLGRCKQDKFGRERKGCKNQHSSHVFELLTWHTQKILENEKKKFEQEIFGLIV